MKSEPMPSGQAPSINRRNVLKGMAGGAALAAFSAGTGLRALPDCPTVVNPRWYGFNLLEYFSTDPDWMKHFPYENNGMFRDDDFRWMRDWGFNWARLPMDYRFWTDARDLMKIDERKVEPIDRAIRLGEKYGVHVNISLHRAPGECILDGMDQKLVGIRIVQEPASVYRDQRLRDAFVHQWEFFARRYQGIPSTRISFNLVNEPDDKSAPDEATGRSNYAHVARAAIDSIRAVDPQRLITSDGYPGGGSPVKELFDMHIVQSPHDYWPFQLTHYRVPWARPMSDQVPLPTWPLKDQQGKIIASRDIKDERFRPLKELAGLGVPIHFGEMGCGGHTPPAVVYAWFNDTLDLMKELNACWALWNLRGQFGIVDTGRPGTECKDFHGHKLDYKLLDLLKSKMMGA
jgi:endoglucanase